VSSGSIALFAFDLAGVVCRFDTEHRLGVMAQAAGLEPATVQRLVWDAGIDAAGDRGVLSAAEMCDAVRDALQFTVDDETLRGLYVSAFEPDGAVLDLVDRVRVQAPTALLTNNGPLVLEAMRHELAQVGRHFDPWGFACRYGVEKPDPAIFQALCDEARVSASSVFFVDDSEEHVDAAQSLGMRAHHFTDVRALAHALELL
jgi:HAD superfamily hydrolase (TIGR01509 family)